MKRLVVLSIMVMVLGCASWAGAYTYSVVQVGVQDKYGVFTNDSGIGAVVDLELYYDAQHCGSKDTYYAYSTNSGGAWTAIPNLGDSQPSEGEAGSGQLWTSLNDNVVIAPGGSFWLKYVGFAHHSSYDADLTSYNTSAPPPYWFAFNDGDCCGCCGEQIGCVAVVEGAPIPIPGAAWLLGSGFGALMIARRRRKA